jgi:hypothetical protein
LGENFHFPSIFYQIFRKKAMEILRTLHGRNFKIFADIRVMQTARQNVRKARWAGRVPGRPAIWASFVYPG